MAEDLFSKLRQKCWDNALDDFGYTYIFDKRAEKFKKLIFWLNFSGLAVPISVGATTLGYGINSSILKQIMPIAVFLVTIQFLISLWSILGKWDEKLAYSYESSQAHNNLCIQFRKLAEFPPSNYDDFRHQFDVVDADSNSRSRQDVKHNLKDWEKRRGMKAGLREFQRACVECKIVPTSMKSTNCNVCGNYSFHF